MDENVIRNEIEQGIAQVDSTLTIDDLACIYDSDTRELKVAFTAKKPNDEKLEVGVSWQ